MSQTLTQRIADEHAVSFEPQAADLASRRRRSALEKLTARGLPGPRDENWKYANLRPLDRVRFAPSSLPGVVPQSGLPAAIPEYARYTFVDGIFVSDLSTPLASKAGITFQSLRETAHADHAGESVDARFALLNEAFAIDGAKITATTNTDCPACIELVFVATADAGAAASYPRVELCAGANSRLGIIERHVSIGTEMTFADSTVHVALDAGAHVSHYRIQQAGSQATWLDTVQATLARDADYQLHLINLGAASARSTIQVSLSGERARFGLHCASVADRQQVHDVFALVDHMARDTISRQSFRGIAAGRSRVACNSKVVVQEGAKGADSHQSLRGLLAGPDAEIDVRPQLEIYTDDVRCAHGATAGKLDDTMLFYLLSRGLDRDTAQLLLKWAFLEDVVSQIAVPQLRRQIEQGVAGRMKGSAALAELL